MSSRPVPGFVGGGRSVTVTREEDHQAVLAGIPAGRTVAELGHCTIGAGKYRGRRAVEVRLGGQRVGELTYAMSERYAALVQPGTTCAATVTDGPRGRQVTVLLPEPASIPAMTAALPPSAAAFAPGGPAAGLPPAGPGAPRPTGAARVDPEPPTEVIPVIPPGHRPDTTAMLPGPGRSGPLVVPGQRGPRKEKKSRRPVWIAAGAAAAAVVVVAGLVGGGGEDPVATTAAGTTAAAAPTTVLPPPTSPLPTSAPPTSAPASAAAAPAPRTTEPVRRAAAPPVTAAPAPVQPAPQPTAAPPQAGAGPGCHPSYVPCLPKGRDLDCKDVKGPIRVIGPDEYKLDGDKNGIACEPR